MTEDPKHPAVAQNLQALVKKSLMRQSDVAGSAGIPKDAFNRYFHGRNRPPPQKTVAIARVLGCSPRDIDPDLPEDGEVSAEGVEILPLPPGGPKVDYTIRPASDGDLSRMRIHIDADLPSDDVLKILCILTSRNA